MAGQAAAKAARKRAKVYVDPQGEAKKPRKARSVDWQPLENYALACAALSVMRKPDLNMSDMPRLMSEQYPLKLREAYKQYPQKWNLDVMYKGDTELGLAAGAYTIEASCTLRSANLNLYKRYTDEICRPSKNQLSAYLATYYNADGKLPSGGSPEEARKHTLNKWWASKQKPQTPDHDLTGDEPANGGGGGGGGGDQQQQGQDTGVPLPDGVPLDQAAAAAAAAAAEAAQTSGGFGQPEYGGVTPPVFGDINSEGGGVAGAEGGATGGTGDDAPATPSAKPTDTKEGKTADGIKPMPPDWDGGAIFFQWEKLGPLGENTKEYRIPGVAPQPKPKTEGGPANGSSAGGTSRASRKEAQEADRQERLKRDKAAKADDIASRMDTQRQMSEFYLRKQSWESKYKQLRDERADACDEKDDDELARVKAALRAHKLVEPNLDEFLASLPSAKPKDPAASPTGQKAPAEEANESSNEEANEGSNEPAGEHTP